jgi:hypothetical protein
MIRDGAAVGHHRSTAIVGGYALFTAARESNHYPLAVQVQPGDELRVGVEFDIDVFDTASIGALFARLQRVWWR